MLSASTFSGYNCLQDGQKWESMDSLKFAKQPRIPWECTRNRGRMESTCGHCGAVNRPAGIGLEATLGEWVENIVAVGREVWRVLRDDGTFVD